MLPCGYTPNTDFRNATRTARRCGGHLNRRLLRKLRDAPPGIAARKPAGHRARYEFPPVIEETGVVLYWWRVPPGEGRVPLPEVRLPRVSHLQQHLMTLTPTLWSLR